MSEKNYTPFEVAQQVLGKCKEIAIQKGLFAEKAVEKCSPKEWKPETKADCAREIKWKLQQLKEIKELSWTVESEMPSAKDIFEKEFERVKGEISALVRRCNGLKKSEDEEQEDEIIAKAETEAEEICKAEKKDTKKCGDMKIVKEENITPTEVSAVVENKTNTNGKLQNFMETRKKKKTADMEKKLGIQSAPIK